MSTKKEFEKLHENALHVGCEIISWGLAPNPNGYCYEIICEETFESSSKEEIDHLNYLCEHTPRGAI